MYSKKVLDHFLCPRNTEVLERVDGIGMLGDPDCGDFIKVYIKVENDRITGICFQIKGCPAAIACGSVMTELALGLTLDEAVEITGEDILDNLGELPAGKEHCSNLGVGALYEAIANYILKAVG